jgi:hypothetical protein
MPADHLPHIAGQPLPAPRDVLADARAYLSTAHDTRAAALIDGLAAEVSALRWQAGVDQVAVDRAQHHADMERIDAGDLAGTDTVTVFAVLRDIADAEPLIYQGDISGVTCVLCDAVAPGAEPVPHLISCPWARAVRIVGVKTGG